MARLNNTIKLLFCCGELFFLLVSLICLAASCLVYVGKIDALQFNAARSTAELILLLSTAMLICTCFGCCGMFRQTIRKAKVCCFTGRRILCLHQVLLLTVLLFTVSQYEWLNKREYSMRSVVSGNELLQEYDSFERRVSKFFNQAYFESLCSEDASGKEKWLLNFVDEKCPDSMKNMNSCALTPSQRKTCDTTCSALRGLTFTSIDLMQCCPSEDLCNSGNLQSCPYQRCRLEISLELLRWASYTKIFTQCVCALAGLMIVLSLLLICFNPRDEIEVELLKTNVMTEQDLEMIRRLKNSHNVTTKRRGSVSEDDLNLLKDNNQRSSLFSRKRYNRVSPTNV